MGADVGTALVAPGIAPFWPASDFCSPAMYGLRPSGCRAGVRCHAAVNGALCRGYPASRPACGVRPWRWADEIGLGALFDQRLRPEFCAPAARHG
jgi:hypothetical protein